MKKDNNSDEFANWDKYIDPRIKKLEENNFFLESFFLHSATIEFILKEAIKLQESWIKNVLKKSNLTFNLKTKELEQLPLGRLIERFSKHCKDIELISKLNEFNSIRIEFVHNILKYSTEQLNTKAKDKKILPHILINQICKYNLKIIEKHRKSFEKK